jgi:hypothetical protein
MPSDFTLHLRAIVANARACLNEYQRVAQTTERSIVETVILARKTIAQSHDLLDRVGAAPDSTS